MTGLDHIQLTGGQENEWKCVRSLEATASIAFCWQEQATRPDQFPEEKSRKAQDVNTGRSGNLGTIFQSIYQSSEMEGLVKHHVDR